MASQLNELSQSDITTADSIPFFSVTNGASRRTSVAQLKTALGIPATASMATQYAAPAATGFTVTIAPPNAGQSVYLLLTPVAGYAAGTIALPAATSAVDGQEVLCSTTQAVTALTVSSSGASVIGAPTTLAANAFFRLRFDAVVDNWYRVG